MSALEKIAFTTHWKGLLGRNLITLDELSGQEIIEIVDEALILKAARQRNIRMKKTLTDRHIALIFLRPSFRTRCAFSIGTMDCGGQPHLLDPKEIRLGSKESYRDIARVMSRMFDLVVIRCMDNEMIYDLERHLEIPIWNAMTDQDHPTQVIADLMTLVENGIEPAGARLASQYQCVACHATDRKLVGPSFADIAGKYKGQDAHAALARKVKAGGQGAWGSVPMPPQPQIPDSDVHAMVGWILEAK